MNTLKIMLFLDIFNSYIVSWEAELSSGSNTLTVRIKNKQDSLLGWNLNFIFENITCYSVNQKIHECLIVFQTVSVKTDLNENESDVSVWI